MSCYRAGVRIFRAGRAQHNKHGKQVSASGGSCRCAYHDEPSTNARQDCFLIVAYSYLDTASSLLPSLLLPSRGCWSPASSWSFWCFKTGCLLQSLSSAGSGGSGWHPSVGDHRATMDGTSGIDTSSVGATSSIGISSLMGTSSLMGASSLMGTSSFSTTNLSHQHD